jgi:hypothetical protein
MKTCRQCHVEKDLTKFSKETRNNDGLKDQCKDCYKLYLEENKAKNKAKDFSQLLHLKCTKCKEIKDISNFSPKQNNPRGFEYWCKQCVNDTNRQERRERVDNFRANFKTNVPCLDCGKIYDAQCMDYDHVPGRGRKIASISRMVLNDYSQDELLAEIAKCDLVCLLCHNIRTRDRFIEKRDGTDIKYHPQRQKNINIINEFKSRPCVICNVQYDLCNMRIDHIDPYNKLWDVCKLKGDNTAILLAEIAKCQVVCALCHRLKSLGDQRLGLYPKSRPEPEPEPKPKSKFVINVELQTKECSTCHKIKSFDDFYKDVANKDGLNYSCSDCITIAKKKKRGTYQETPLSPFQKQCSNCNVLKDIPNFSTRTDGGLASWCSECYNTYRRKLRKEKRLQSE